MKKLRLDLDMLVVEQLAVVADGQEALGTVQAHPPTTVPVANTAEDGQLVLLLPVK